MPRFGVVDFLHCHTQPRASDQEQQFGALAEKKKNVAVEEKGSDVAQQEK